jgi:DsbC/DsbD-like thiol-disulfide interchange protein
MPRRFMGRFIAILAFAAVGLLAFSSEQTFGQGKKSDSVVKVTATADKPDGDGKQVVTVMLTHNEGWHTYANPVGQDDLAAAQTTVTVNAKTKPEDVKVDYPEGKVIKDKIVGDYKVYADKVTIKATVKRAKGDTSPLEVSVKIQACTAKECLIPATVKLTVPEK